MGPQEGARGQCGSLAGTLRPGRSVKPLRGLGGNGEAGCCGHLGRPSGSLKMKLRPQNSPLRGAAGIFSEIFVCAVGNPDVHTLRVQVLGASPCVHPSFLQLLFLVGVTFSSCVPLLLTPFSCPCRGADAGAGLLCHRICCCWH